jgi:hypothetical protein
MIRTRAARGLHRVAVDSVHHLGWRWGSTGLRRYGDDERE